MAKKYVHRAQIILSQRGEIAGVLDMLRYDNARVLCQNTAPDAYRTSWTIESDQPFTPDRWFSMGIQIIEAGSYPVS